MNSRIQIVSLVVSLLVILWVTQLIRTRKLREEYAILWFAGAIGLFLLSLKRDLINVAAEALGVVYPPSLLLLAAIFLGFLIAMHFSVSLSRLSEQNKVLAQQLALLKDAVEQRTRAPGNDAAREST